LFVCGAPFSRALLDSKTCIAIDMKDLNLLRFFLYGGRSTLISNGSPVLFYRHCPSLKGSLGTRAASLSMEQEVAKDRPYMIHYSLVFRSKRFGAMNIVSN
jgi:hypothetical protein